MLINYNLFLYTLYFFIIKKYPQIVWFNINPSFHYPEKHGLTSKITTPTRSVFSSIRKTEKHIYMI